MRLLYLGDVVGRAGRNAIRDRLAGLKARLRADFIIVNGENATSGHGLSPDHAKGLLERFVLYKHVLRNAMIPIVALGGLYAVVLIGSSVMVEIVFSRPGLGKLMVGAIKQRDYTTLQSVMVIYAVIVVLINLATDLIYSLIDPRIKYN